MLKVQAMQGVFLKNSRFFARAFLFFGVLTALLFSCGEGVRLLPFPVLGSGQDEKSVLRNAKHSGYQKNVLRFDAGEGNNSSKIKRGGKDSPAVDFVEPGTTSVFRPHCQLAFWSENSAENFKTQSPVLHMGSRAPPFS